MDWNFLFSVITGVTAIIAIVLTIIQIQLSNKQNLFDRRLESYIKIDGLIQLYQENKNLIESNRKDEPIFSVDFEFLWLTNNTYLEEVCEAIKKPLEEPGHKKFLIKREELKKLAVEAELVFKGTTVANISRFILAYEHLLFRMCQYKILLENMREYSEKFKATLEEAQEVVSEPSHRRELLEAYTAIKLSYSQVLQDKTVEKLRRQIKL